MSCSCSSFCSTSERHRYRRKGPPVTTRLLRDGLRAAGPLTGTLLDIGSGIGALTLQLLEIGVKRAVAVDASEAVETILLYLSLSHCGKSQAAPIPI